MLFQNIKKKIVNQTITIICLVFLIISIILVLITYIGTWKNLEVLQLFLREIGTLLIVSLIISIIWELRLKRIFLDEILDKMNLKRDMFDTGITKITDSFKKISNLEWSAFFNDVNELDIFICYAYTWRRSQMEEFNNLKERGTTKIRVILPNPEHSDTIHTLALRFNYSTSEITRKINEAIDFFKNLKENSNLELNIWLLNEPPLFSIYRFDNKLILALFTHRDNVSVPSFICRKDGTLYNYYYDEFNDLISKGNKIT